jgi:hypothetical protein
METSSISVCRYLLCNLDFAQNLEWFRERSKERPCRVFQWKQRIWRQFRETAKYGDAVAVARKVPLSETSDKKVMFQIAIYYVSCA